MRIDIGIKHLELADPDKRDIETHLEGIEKIMPLFRSANDNDDLFHGLPLYDNTRVSKYGNKNFISTTYGSYIIQIAIITATGQSHMKIIYSLLLITAVSCSTPDQYHHDRESTLDIAGIEIYLPLSRMDTGSHCQANVLMLHETGEKSFAPKDAVSWRAADDGIVTVDDAGVVAACAAGRGVITATMEEFTATAVIDVRQGIDYAKLLINEVYCQPQQYANAEFIELINTNEYDCDLSGLLLVDGGASIKPFSIPSDSIIPAMGILVIAKNTQQYIDEFGRTPDLDGFTFGLNDTGETVLLMKPEGAIIDCVYIRGGTELYPPPPEWGSANQPSSSKGRSVFRIGPVDTDSAADWVSGLPTPGW